MNTSKLVLYILLIAAVTLSLFLIYKTVNSFELRGYYFFQSIFFIILSILSIIIIFIKKFQIYYLITIFSLIFSLYLFEGYIFFQSGITFFTNKSEFYKNNQYHFKNEAIKTNSYPFMLVNTKELLSFSGMPNTKTILCNENDYFSKYQSDKFGFNNPNHVWDKVPDLVLLGDSFIHGACVNEGKDISSIIRKNSSLNVINLGQTSTGSLKQFASFQEHIRYFPKYVLWFYFENDLNDLEGELQNEILLKYLNDEEFNQKLNEKFKSNEISQNLQLNYNNFLNTQFQDGLTQNYFKNFYDFLKLYKSRQIIIYNFTKSQTNENPIYKEKYNKLLNKHLEIIEKMQNILYKHNSTLTIIYLPGKKYRFY